MSWGLTIPYPELLEAYRRQQAPVSSSLAARTCRLRCSWQSRCQPY